MLYEIKYMYKGKKGTEIVRPVEGYETRFYEYCIDRIDSLTRAGATITETTKYHPRQTPLMSL